MNAAYIRLQAARDVSKEAQSLYQARELPSPDGTFGFNKALHAETLALAEYRRVVRQYADLVVYGRVPHEDANK